MTKFKNILLKKHKTISFYESFKFCNTENSKLDSKCDGKSYTYVRNFKQSLCNNIKKRKT